jgi:hypothetical protein
MDNQKTIQIVMMALLIISTTMGILTYIALMSMSGGVSFNPSSAFSGGFNYQGRTYSIDIATQERRY